MTDFLSPQPAGIPVPRPTLVSRPFWEGCLRGELLFQRCKDCGNANFAPAVACRGCLSSSLAWTPSSGRGNVYSWTVVWRPQTPDFTVPYAPAIIDLDEGYQMLTNIVGCTTGDLRSGLAVAVQFVSLSPGIALPYFRPLDAGKVSAGDSRGGDSQSAQETRDER